ncbi:hypothetical protein RchiOBHm_Chr5g0063201 [Rosa chinensis]|uniref:DUF247 domain protein n=1 Tax=Rosa chinensis TaxID=74649 RepID=A0A2P6QIF1_ROSCH|nr:UPF0481 protein At3g47200 [Rosa chinensis]XP_024161367.1 UPF0481 protein At3g47200 [Rosa chinensis]XP_024161368.1 UPF0481 protein At3g47200 [Rosa chinensis]XP_040361617.1 UPF0481 protein At3g47200 [Rosa chinensis]PRQ33933.1 hypothetical protein RchiOBHm_Chr5g0063201 [Rosa chinensis]
MTESSVNDHVLIEIRDGGGYVNVNKQTPSGNSMGDKLLASQIRDKLSLLSPLPVPSCIFKIPSVLRSQVENKDFGTPDLVSIGPFHHEKVNLQAMEKIKLRYLRSLLVRKPTPETTLENFVREIRSMEVDCGDCYDGEIEASSDKFVEMMVVDACFIIELFRKFSGEVPKEENDPVFCRSWMRTALINDLILLSNQLPWKVLSRLFELTWETGKHHLHDLILEYFKGYTFGLSPQANGEIENKHVLDFFRNCFLDSFETKMSEFKDLSSNSIPSAERLFNAGVRFAHGPRNSMLNIVFCNGILKIPPIRVQKYEVSFLRNLIAYEQCAPITGVITSYVSLLGDLIREERDAQILLNRGIIQGFSSEEGIASLISLRADLQICSSPYTTLYENVNRFTAVRWNVWRAILINDYFKNPLDFVNLSVGVFFVTFLTLIQTIISIASYHKPQSQ